jgi:hypothetical protein
MSDFPGQPGTLLWNENFTEFNISGPYFGDEGFAINDAVYPHNHLTFYRIDIENITDPFVQFNGTIYWLVLTIPWFGDPHYPGWKTSGHNTLSPAKIGPHDGWFSITDPIEPYDPFDLAFVITGEPMELGDQTEFPDAKMETIQQPNPNGWDMWFNWWNYGYLADDWNCTETTQVTGIHFWVSWYSDIDVEIPWINVSIASDTPGSPNTILWSREYDDNFTIAGPYYGDEGFAFAGDNYYEHNHQKFYRINIENITDPFLQENSTIYWLVLKLPIELNIGWKTSLNDTLSSAMYGGIEGWYPIGNPTPPYEEFDFAFVITGEEAPWELHNGWNEYPDNPIYGATLGNGTAYYPCVIKDENNFSGYGNDSTWRMWYDAGSGIPNHVISSDGINWGGKIACTGINTVYHPIVTYEEDGFGNGYHYRMDWTTYPAGINDITTMKYAWSDDGINWYNTTSLQQHPSNSTLWLVNGTTSEWNYQTCGASMVFYNDSGTNMGNDTETTSDDEPWSYKWVIFYDVTGGSNGYCASALAYSSNGTYFIRHDGPNGTLIAPDGVWDDGYATHLYALHLNGTWLGWYSGGLLASNEGIGFATSPDGFNWTEDADPVMHKTDGVVWRSERTYTPWVIKDGNYYKMWYTGQNGAGQKNIGYAVFSSPLPEVYNETIINGTAYASVYNSMLSVTVTGYNPPLRVVFKYGNGTIITTVYNVENGSTVFCNLSEFHQPYPWLSHDTTYYWYVTVITAYDYSTDSQIWWFHTSMAWDCNEDKNVTYLDVSILVADYFESGYLPGEISADIIEDGIVNYLDVSSLVSHYGESY